MEKKVHLVHIVACTTNGVIGKEGKIPWHIPADFKHFKETTKGGVLVMGRKTFESLPGILPGRDHFVVSRNLDFAFGDKAITALEDGQVLSKSSCLDVVIKEAKQRALEKGLDKVFIIGGSEIYMQTLPMISQAIITVVADEVNGDAFYPLEHVSNLKIHQRKETILRSGSGGLGGNVVGRIVDLIIQDEQDFKYYRHYKGGTYKMLHQGKHADTNVEYVVYQSIETGQVWVLPYGEFFKKMPSKHGAPFDRFILLNSMMTVQL